MTYTPNNEVIASNTFRFLADGDIFINANLFVSGNFGSVETTNFSVDDNIILLANNNDLGTLDMGFIMHRPISNVAIGYRETQGEFIVAYTDSQHLGSTIVPKNSDMFFHVYGNVLVDHNVTANYFFGDGSTLSNVANLHKVAELGNITSNTLQLMNSETAFLLQGNIVSSSGFLRGKTNGVQSIYVDANRVAMGHNAGQTSQGDSAVAVGYLAGQTSQGQIAVAVGHQAGQTSQGSYATAVGYRAGQTSQGSEAVAVGYLAGNDNQGRLATALGIAAGQVSQGTLATALGVFAGLSNQGNYAIAVGDGAGSTSQGNYAVAVGSLAGDTSQSTNSVAVGREAGRSYQGVSSVAVGYQAGQFSQNNTSVAVGWNAGQSYQGANSVAAGVSAGLFSQGAESVSVGNQAGYTSQGPFSVAVGWQAALTNQNNNATALGGVAGKIGQFQYATAVGFQAGEISQGSSAVALGYLAGQTNQHDNSIVINGTGLALNSTQASSFFVNPVRNVTAASNVLSHITASGEIISYSSVSLDDVGNMVVTGDVTALSDKREKSNIEPIQNALLKIDKLTGYTYNMNGNDTRHTGLIAQEVLEVLPEAVHGSEDTKYSLAYGNIIGLLVEGIKELKKEIAELKKNMR